MNIDARLEARDGGRVWQFGPAEFDEARRELRVRGAVRAIEAKPLALLQDLLSRAGEAATKEELLAAVWPGVRVVEQSLPTAISKLRAALQDETRLIVEAVHGIGYRIGVPIVLRAGTDRERLAFRFKSGDHVPNRPQWRLERELGEDPARDVWLACHEKTGEWRVFKFADTAQRLEALKREAALSRILHNALGDRPDIVRVSEWNFEARPYFIESPYGGISLSQWAASRGGIGSLTVAERIGLVAAIARTVAAAHDVGVLHRDIKPSNILVKEVAGRCLPRLVDFGAGRLTEGANPEAVTVTGLGLAGGRGEDADPVSGTPRYMAPEVLAGGAATMSGDVYALGILLYQMVAGDLARPLTAGWEDDIEDALLRQDIADAAAGDMARRIVSAAALAERLETLGERRADALAQADAQARAALAMQQQERSRVRRPWIAFAGACLVVGTVVSGLAAWRASAARGAAERQAELAQAVDTFLIEDLLGRANPRTSQMADETLMQAVTRAEPRIEWRFGKTPLLAATIYSNLGIAYEMRGATPDARRAFDQSASAFEKAEGVSSPGAAIVRLLRASMEAYAGTAASIATAKNLVGQVQAVLPAIGARHEEVRAWLLAAQGAVSLAESEPEKSLPAFQAALALAASQPAVFGEDKVLRMRFRLGEALLDSNRHDEAITTFTEVEARQRVLNGNRNPDRLTAALELAEALEDSGRYEECLALVSGIIPDMVGVFGTKDVNAALALGLQGDVLMKLGRAAEAVPVDTSALAAAIASRGAQSEQAIDAMTGLGAAQCRAGDLASGLATTQQALVLADTAFGGGQANAQAARLPRALCLILSKQYAAAQGLLQGVDHRTIATMLDDDFPDETIDMLQAALAAGLGDTAREAALVKVLRSGYASGHGDAFFRGWTERLAGDVTK